MTERTGAHKDVSEAAEGESTGGEAQFGIGCCFLSGAVFSAIGTGILFGAGWGWLTLGGVFIAGWALTVLYDVVIGGRRDTSKEKEPHPKETHDD